MIFNLKRHVYPIFLILLVMVIGIANLIPHQNTVYSQAVTCADIEPEILGGQPGTIVYINIPPEADNVEAYFRPAGLSSDVRTEVVLLSNEDGQYYFVVPNHPPESPIDDDMPIIIEIIFDGQTCEHDFSLGGMTCRQDAFNEFVTTFEDMLIAEAQHYGYSANDLITLSVDDVPDYLEILWEEQFFVNHPNNPNALHNIIAGTSPLLGELELDMQLLNCGLTRFDMLPLLEESIAYFNSQDVLDIAGLPLDQANFNVFAKPSLQTDIDLETLDSLTKDQQHAARQAEQFNSPALDTLNSVVGLHPVACPATSMISILRARTLNKFVKSRDTLPAKVDRMTSELTPNESLPEDYPGTVKVLSAVIFVVSNGYSSSDYEFGQAVNAVGTVACLGSTVKANGKTLDMAGNSATGVDMSRNVAGLIGQSLGPKPSDTPIFTWSIVIKGLDVETYLWLLPGNNESGQKVLRSVPGSNSLTALEVIGTGRSVVDIRLNDNALGNLSVRTTDTVTIEIIDVFIEEKERRETDEFVYITLEGTIQDAYTTSAEWTYTDQHGVKFTKPVAHLNLSMSPENTPDNIDPIFTIAVERPKAKWVNCELQDAKVDVEVNLKSTTNTGARRPEFATITRDQDQTITVNALPIPTPPECEEPTPTPTHTPTPTPTPTVTPAPNNSKLYFATVVGFTLSNKDRQDCFSNFVIDSSTNLQHILSIGTIQLDAPIRLWLDNGQIRHMQPTANWHGDPDYSIPVINWRSDRTLPIEALDVVPPDLAVDPLEFLHGRWSFMPMNSGEWYLANYSFYSNVAGCLIRYHYVLTFGFQRPPNMTPYINAIELANGTDAFMTSDMLPSEQ